MKYSQNNEQTIISNYFQGKIGRFLDIGAYDGIVAGSDLFELVMQPLEKAQAHYPYAGLNVMTGGIRAQELVVVTAGSGLGKSTVAK